MKTKIEKTIEEKGYAECIVESSPAEAGLSLLGDDAYFKPAIDRRMVVEVYKGSTGGLRYRDSQGDSWEEARLA